MDSNRAIDVQVATALGWSDFLWLLEGERGESWEIEEPTDDKYYREIYGNMPGADIEDDRVQVPHWSTELTDAWWLVTEMAERGYSWIAASAWDNSGYQMDFSRDRNQTIGGEGLQPTFPLAICRAALAAL